MNSVRQLSPEVFLIRTNVGAIFDQSQTKSSVCVEVTVCTVVHHLKNGPAAWSVGKSKGIGP